MNERTFLWLVIAVLGVLLLAVGGFGAFLLMSLPYQAQTESPYLTRTALANTVLTRMVEDSVDITPTPSPTSVPPTAVPTRPSATSTPAWTATPTRTFTPTPVPIPCDGAKFISDVTVKDGSVFWPGESFTKIWRLKNTGRCTWTPSYTLVFISGDRLGAKRAVPMPDYVAPGSAIDLGIKMTAPKEQGGYRGYWQLRNADGELFGLGDAGQGSMWVAIEVTTPRYERAFDFASDLCEAQWLTESGSLPCPGQVNPAGGFVHYLEDPALEHRREDEPTIWVHPGLEEGGWIAGTYPFFTVREGDRFRALVGCMAESQGCRVTFRLDYQRMDGGPAKNLGAWREKFDGEATRIDLDLSELAGKKVRFILVVETRKNPDAANAFWFMPHIDRLAR